MLIAMRIICTKIKHSCIRLRIHLNTQMTMMDITIVDDDCFLCIKILNMTTVYFSLWKCRTNVLFSYVASYCYCQLQPCIQLPHKLHIKIQLCNQLAICMLASVYSCRQIPNLYCTAVQLHIFSYSQLHTLTKGQTLTSLYMKAITQKLKDFLLIEQYFMLTVYQLNKKGNTAAYHAEIKYPKQVNVT